MDASNLLGGFDPIFLGWIGAVCILMAVNHLRATWRGKKPPERKPRK